MINAETVAGMRAMWHNIMAQIGVTIFEFDLDAIADALETLARFIPSECPDCDSKGEPEITVGLTYGPNPEPFYGRCEHQWHEVSPLARAILGEEGE